MIAGGASGRRALAGVPFVRFRAHEPGSRQARARPSSGAAAGPAVGLTPLSIAATRRSKRDGLPPLHFSFGSIRQSRRLLSAQVAARLAATARSFDRLEQNTGGVPKEKFALSDVARKHGVGSVSGLLPDPECRDARASRARREAGAQAMP